MAELWDLRQPLVAQHPNAAVDVAIAALADAQHGVVALAQLVALGLSRAAVSKRVAAGRLHRLHRGVYAVGHTRLGARGRWLAAVLACGDGAALSHRSAAAHRELLPMASGPIHVSVRGDRRRPGIAVHRTDHVPRDVEIVDGIPVTTVTRSLLDLADTVPYRLLERAVENAERQGTLDAAPLLATANRPGAPALRRALVAHAPHTESELERRVLSLIARAHLPRPQSNAPISLEDGPIRADFLWPAQRVVLEADGYEYHRTTRAHDRDRRRDQALARAGYTPLRTTWPQVTRDPDGLVLTLRALLGAS